VQSPYLQGAQPTRLLALLQPAAGGGGHPVDTSPTLPPAAVASHALRCRPAPWWLIVLDGQCCTCALIAARRHRRRRRYCASRLPRHHPVTATSQAPPCAPFHGIVLPRNAAHQTLRLICVTTILLCFSIVSGCGWIFFGVLRYRYSALPVGSTGTGSGGRRHKRMVPLPTLATRPSGRSDTALI